jgi:hypothetical protein
MFKPFKDIFMDFRRVVGLYVETEMAPHLQLIMIFFVYFRRFIKFDFY